RFRKLGAKITSHAAAMMITRTTGIISSTYLPCGKTLTTGISTVVDGRGMTVPTLTVVTRPSPGALEEFLHRPGTGLNPIPTGQVDRSVGPQRPPPGRILASD